MSARTRELPIRPSAPSSAGTIELHIVGPAKKKTAAFNALRKLGFEQIADSIPWRLAFPELEDPDVPGACLRGVRKREGLTQEELATHTGIPQRHISEMENAKRPIGKKNAVLLANALDVSYRILRRSVRRLTRERLAKQGSWPARSRQQEPLSHPGGTSLEVKRANSRWFSLK